MKYLRKFNESVDINVIKDIEDICLELNDVGEIYAKVNKLKNGSTYVYFDLKDHLDYDGFSFEDISEYVLRIKDFLGDNYKGSEALFVDDLEDKLGFLTDVNLDDKSDLDKLKDSKIKNFVIKLK